MRHRPATLCAALVGALVAAQPGCRDREQKKAPSQAPEEPHAAQLEELGAIPASVRFVVRVRAERARSSALVQRALEQMFARDRALEARLDTLLTMCAFDPKSDLLGMTMGLGSGVDEVIMVVTAKVEESELARCLNRAVAELGGSLSSKPMDGRTFYRAGRAERGVWFAFASEGRVAVSPSEDFLRTALGAGPKAQQNEVLSPLIRRVDRDSSAIWVVGQIPESIGSAVVDLTGNQIAAPPKAIAGRIDLSDGVDAVLEVEMASPEDAHAAVEKALPQVALSALSVQRYGLGPVVNKLQLDADGSWFKLRISLGEKELNDALFRVEGREEEVDTGRQSEQDTPRSSPEK